VNEISDYHTIKLCLLIDTCRICHDHMTESRERSTDEGSGLGNISKSLHVHEKPLKLLICGFVSVEEWGVWPGGRGAPQRWAQEGTMLLQSSIHYTITNKTTITSFYQQFHISDKS